MHKSEFPDHSFIYIEEPLPLVPNNIEPKE